MARPERNNVDYYPFLCKEGKAMFYIEQTYGNDGYATWVKILRQLAVTNYHYLDLNDKVEFMYLSSKCRVTTDVLSNIIQDLCDLGEFNADLWKDYRIIFSEKFVLSVKDAYNKRSNECITLQSLLILLNGLGLRKLSLSESEVPVKPHRRVEKSKEEKSKVKKITVASLSEKQSGEVFSLVKEFFLGIYNEEFKTQFYFEPKNGAKIYSIIRKVYFKMKEKEGREIFSVDEVANATNFFIQATLSTADTWLSDNFNLSNIDSKFNDIYSKIRNGKSGNTKNSRPVSRFRKS